MIDNVFARPFIRTTAALALAGLALTSTVAAQEAAPTAPRTAATPAPSLTLAAQQPAAAGQTTTTISPGHWTLTPFIGFGFSGDLDSGTGAFGVAGGYVWNPRWSFEGEFTMLPSSENSGVIEAESTVWTLAANALYHFSGREWVPYGVAGIGFGHAGVEIDDDVFGQLLDESSNEFIANVGGGVERLIANNVGFRGDVRYFFGGDLVPDYWRLSAGLTLGFRPR